MFFMKYTNNFIVKNKTFISYNFTFFLFVLYAIT